jgi:putative endonuclease
LSVKPTVLLRIDGLKLKGDKGEREACHYLKKIGYKIHKTNLRVSHWEIDIVAVDSGVMVFVEVKLRSTEYFGPPEDALTAKQQRNIVDASDVYVKKIQWKGDVRFDFIAVIQQNNTFRIMHFRDAFWPFTLY